MNPHRALCRVLIVCALIAPELAAAQWTYRASKDALTDKKVSFASYSYRVNSLKAAGAVVRCKDDKLEAYFSVGEFLTTNDSVPVRYRIDRKPLQEESWSPAGDGLAAFASDARGVAFLMAMGNQLVLEATDFHGQPHRATYPLVGAKKVIGKVLEDCGESLTALKERGTPTALVSIAGEIERWGPKTTKLVKEALRALKKYKGAVDETKPPSFVDAVQSFYEDWLRRCKNNQADDNECATMWSFWESAITPQMPLAVSIVTEFAPAHIKEQLSLLSIRD